MIHAERLKSLHRHHFIMPFRKGYKKAKGSNGRTFMAPKPKKGAGKKAIKKEGKIYAACRSSPQHSADTHENKSYCAKVAHSKSGA
jgi:hypothetical protein